MSFKGSVVNASMQLFSKKVDGVIFEWMKVYPGHCTMTTEFSVNCATVDVNVNYPISSQHCPEMDMWFSLSDLKDLYYAEYGPYTSETLTSKLVELFKEFGHADRSKELLGYPERHYLRKMWLFKKLNEIFEDSMGLIVTRMSKLVVNIYEKAVKVIKDSKTTSVIYTGKNTEKYTKLVLDVVLRVKQKVAKIIAEDAKYIKMLSPSMLKCFVEEAEPWMVAKFSSLPWIEPELAVMVAPNYNLYWSEFWFVIFMKHFKFSSDICRTIADYMPSSLKGETFLNFFERKYDISVGYKGTRVFTAVVKQEFDPADQHYLTKINITL